MLCFFRLLEMLLKKLLEIEFKMSNSNLNSVYDKTHIQLIVALQFLFCACQNIGIRLSHFWRCHFIFEWFYEDASPACASQHSGRRTSRNTEMDSGWESSPRVFLHSFCWCKTLLQVCSFFIQTNWEGFAFVWPNMDLTYHHIMPLHLRLFLD